MCSSDLFSLTSRHAGGSPPLSEPGARRNRPKRALQARLSPKNAQWGASGLGEPARIHPTRRRRPDRQATASTADQAGLSAATATTYDNQGRTATYTPPADNAGQRPQQATTYTATDKVRFAKLVGTTLSDTAYDSRDWSASETDAAGRATQFVRHANGDLFEKIGRAHV